MEEVKVEENSDEKIQVITSEQMMNLKLDNLQLSINNLPAEIVKAFNSQEQ